MKQFAVAILVALSIAPFAAQSVGPQSTDPSLQLKNLDGIEPLIRQAIGEKKLPGAVVLIGRRDRTLYEKAFGNRALVPTTEPMTLDTIFDLLSLTKVVATTTSVMMLVEEGKIRLSDRVSGFIPGRQRFGKAVITVCPLMAHMSGLRPDVDLGDTWSGYDTAISIAIEEVPTSSPGERFVYSDINYFLLGEIIHRVSGEPLDQFAHDRIFAPLGMNDTMFLPPVNLRGRIAPTESCTPQTPPCGSPGTSMLRGMVHDPTARRMAASPGTRDCSARRAILRFSAGCCSTVAFIKARGSFRR